MALFRRRFSSEGYLNSIRNKDSRNFGSRIHTTYFIQETTHRNIAETIARKKPSPKFLNLLMFQEVVEYLMGKTLTPVARTADYRFRAWLIVTRAIVPKYSR
jgi:hypothetical protein